MMRRRFYGGEVLEEFPLVAPEFEDGTPYTSADVASTLNCVDVVDKFNKCSIPNKRYLYAIDDSITSFYTPRRVGKYYYYYTDDEGVERFEVGETTVSNNVYSYHQFTKKGTFGYVVGCGDEDIATCNDGGIVMFTGNCSRTYCSKFNVTDISVNNKMKYCFVCNRYYNSISINDFHSTTTLSGTLTIPSHITKIGSNSFQSCGITKLKLHDKVERLETYCFGGSKLAGIIEIPQSVNYLYSTFGGCQSVTGFVINSNAYYNYNITRNVTSIELGENVTDYHLDDNGVLYYKANGKYECQWCSKLAEFEDIIIEDGCLTIGLSAFYSCNKISGILSIPSSVISIGTSAFYGMSLISELYINSNAYYTYNHFKNENGSLSKFSFGENITDYITDYENKILYYQKDDVFRCILCLNDLQITNIAIKEVSEINDSCFYLCKGIVGELILPTSIGSIGNRAFSYIGVTGNVVMPNIEKLSVDLFRNTPISSIELKEGLTTITQYAIGNTNISELNIPRSVTSILGYGLFTNGNITNITFNWINDSEILAYNKLWSINTDMSRVTLHIPQGTTELYAAKGYTTDVFGTIIDDIIIE